MGFTSDNRHQVVHGFSPCFRQQSLAQRPAFFGRGWVPDHRSHQGSCRRHRQPVAGAPQQLEPVRAALTAAGIPIASGELAKVPQNVIALGEKDAEQALKLMEVLEDHDDVQRISSNLDISSEILAKLQP